MFPILWKSNPLPLAKENPKLPLKIIKVSSKNTLKLNLLGNIRVIEIS